MQDFECPVAMWPVTSDTTSGRLHTFDSGCHLTETRFDQIRCEKSNKTQFCLCTVGDAGERGTFVSILNMKYFIQAVKFR